MKKEGTLKLKKGGLDTIVAYIVVMLPLFYVLIYMIATIYHFAVQQYMNQVVKEACVMASTYGEITKGQEAYIYSKLAKTLPDPDNNNIAYIDITYYKREFLDNEKEAKEIAGDENMAGQVADRSPGSSERPSVNKGDIIGIKVESKDPSILGTVSNFNIFMVGKNREDKDLLHYTAYREEIIRNEPNQ